MLLSTFGVDEYVVNKDYDKLIQLIHKHLVHEIHEISRGISESKRHHSELKLSVTGDKGCLWDVAFPKLELVIS